METHTHTRNTHIVDFKKGALAAQMRKGIRAFEERGSETRLS